MPIVRPILVVLLLAFAVSGKVVMFTRHGQRSPNKYNVDEKARWNDFGEGLLTKNGVDYLIERGSRISQTLPIYSEVGVCDVSNMEIISSLKSRTIMSTFSYLKGMCPKNFKEVNQLFVKRYLTEYSKQQPDLAQLVQADFDTIFELSQFTQSFAMEKDYLFHGSDTCNRSASERQSVMAREIIRITTEKYRAHPEFTNILKIVKEYFPKDVAQNPQKYDITTFALSDMKEFFSNHKCDSAQGFEVPILTKEQQVLLNEYDVNVLNQISTFVFYNLDFGNKNLIVAQVSETYKWLINVLTNGSKSFYWYSAHDTNQVAILQSLISTEERKKLEMISLPPFGSDLQFVEKDGRINVIYNGVQLRTRLCKSGDNCTLEEVVTYLNRFVVQDIEKFCQQTLFNY